MKTKSIIVRGEKFTYTVRGKGTKRELDIYRTYSLGSFTLKKKDQVITDEWLTNLILCLTPRH